MVGGKLVLYQCNAKDLIMVILKACSSSGALNHNMSAAVLNVWVHALCNAAHAWFSSSHVSNLRASSTAAHVPVVRPGYYIPSYTFRVLHDAFAPSFPNVS
jgi:hypothetical protein